MRHLPIRALRDCATEILQRYGHPETHSAMVADVMVDGDLRGYPDHGVWFLGMLPSALRSGRHNPRPNVRVVSETESALLLDGDRGFGVISGMQAIRWCIERARSNRGIACAAVRNAGTVIALAPYVELAARAGVIGFACVNAEPAVAPPGGSTKVFGTNPLAFGVPAGRHYPLIFDTATSSTAALKMRIAALRGEKVPEGLIADEKGRPTTEPREFWPPGGGGPIGSILPLGWPVGSHKGFGLAMVVDVLAGVLTGGGFAQTASIAGSDIGQFYWALDISPFMALEKFRARVDEQIDQVKSSARIEGAGEILVPGERGQRLRESLLARGTVPIPDESWERLEKVCRDLGLTPPM
ncbi:MAG: Ldh family oxidoreductase [Chloroflexota bacterium]|jgi:LDH2 family malate/lactate/ureidoglycolate dehydrogenase